MRSDNLNKHMKVHEKDNENSLYSKSIYSSRASIDNESEFSSSATDWEAPVQKETPLEREAIIRTLKIDDAEYKNKLKLGKIIYEEIEEHEISVGRKGVFWDTGSREPTPSTKIKYKIIEKVK